jgi:DNA-binding NtrC family response regulator
MDPVVLFVSPYLKDAQSLTQMLDEASVSVVHANSLREAAIELANRRFPVVLTEANLEDGNWQDVLRLARPAGAELVVTNPWADSRFWAEAINLGAYDMLAQPFHKTEVHRVLSSASSSRQINTRTAGAVP